MQNKLRQLVLAASLASVFAAASSYGQAKTEYDPGDLILGFQVEGGSQILEVNLGVASLYRDRTTDLLDIINLNSQLTTLVGFGGSNWFNNTTLYFGIAGMRSGTASDDSATNTGAVGVNDPNRTFYFTKSRAGVGSVGFLNSTGVGSATAANAGSVFPGYGGAFDAREVNGIYAGAVQANSWEDRNPITAGVQGSSFTAVPAGIQQAFAAGSFGTFGAAGAVEGVVDLWRDSSYVNAGVPEFLPVGTETYQGSFTIDSDGDVSFIAPVPEPSSAVLLGSAALLGGFLRRRRNS